MKLKVIKILRDVICNIIRNLIIIIILSKCSAVDVVWDLVSRPTIFGRTATLMCSISDTNNNCNGRLYQWLGGKNYDWLCSDTSCDNKKYEAMKQSNCLYILNIHNFSGSDVNIDYACLYGVSNSRKTLLLNQEDFLYIPSRDDIQVKPNSHMNNLGIMVNISKVFPAPTCFTTIRDKDFNNTERIDVRATISNLFYTAEIFDNYSLPACSDLSIYCLVGKSHKINIFEKPADCNGKEYMPAILISLITLAVSAVAVFIISCIRKRRLKETSKTDHTELRPAGKETEAETKLSQGEKNEEQGELLNSTA